MINHLLKINFLALILIIISCRPSPQKAEKYYDNIIAPIEDVFEKEDELIALINIEMEKLANDSSTFLSDPDTIINDSILKKIEQVFSDLQSQIAISKNKLALLTDFNKSSSLKNAAIVLLDEYAELCNNEYLALIQNVKIPAKKYSFENEDEFLELSEIIDNKIDEKLNLLTQEIKLFADKYHFKIQPDTIKTIDQPK